MENLADRLNNLMIEPTQDLYLNSRFFSIVKTSMDSILLEENTY